MLLATKLERTFVFRDKGNDVTLTDPNPVWSVQAVISYYSNMYPVLTTAKIGTPQVVGDKWEYRFESVMGTKG